MSLISYRAVTFLTLVVTIVVSMSSAEAGLDVGMETKLSQNSAETFQLGTESSDDPTPVEIHQTKNKGLFATEIGPHEGYPIAVSCVPRIDAILYSESVFQLNSARPTGVSLKIDHVP